MSQDLHPNSLTPWSRVVAWEGTRSSASQEIPRVLWNPKFHYRIPKSQLPVATVSQISPVHFLETDLKFILILSSRKRCSWLSVTMPFPDDGVQETPISKIALVLDTLKIVLFFCGATVRLGPRFLGST
jgi:hypothetical protein